MNLYVWLAVTAAALVVSLAAMRREIAPNAGAMAGVLGWGVATFGATDLTVVTNCCVTKLQDTLPIAIVTGAFGVYMLLFLMQSVFQLWDSETPDTAGERNRERAGGDPAPRRGGER